MTDLANPGTLDEAAKIRRIMAKRALPESVRDFKLEFGTDSTGDPAVTICGRGYGEGSKRESRFDPSH